MGHTGGIKLCERFRYDCNSLLLRLSHWHGEILYCGKWGGPMGKRYGCVGRLTRLARYVLSAYGLHVRVFFCTIWHTNKYPLLTRVITILFFLGCYMFYHCNYTQLFYYFWRRRHLRTVWNVWRISCPLFSSAEAFYNFDHLKSFTWFFLSRDLLTALLVLSLVPYAVAVRFYMLINYRSSVYCHVPFHYSQC